MSLLGRREVLAALVALAAGGPALAALPEVDAEGGRLVGRAYLAQHPGFDAGQARAELLADGWTSATLRRRVAADFRAGRMFVHRGWRLSDTEGRLFALLAAA
jgi:hypothetical protein